ncbi:hypothetical protein KM043_013320 [Ampulex compressa]|nr:hypothetical protein KM043_013320 [Ampulex compressa]
MGKTGRNGGSEGKVWICDNEVTWRAEQAFKRTSPVNPCSATTSTTTGGGAPAHPHLSPPIAAPVTTPDHTSPSSLHAKLGISPGLDSFTKDMCRYDSF